MSNLYFIRLPDGPVKIGRTNNVQTRLKCLQCASPYPLRLLGTVDGEGDGEWLWHSQFASSRLCGEWFAWGERIEAAVKVALSGGDWRAYLGFPKEMPPPTWRSQLGLPELADA